MVVTDRIRLTGIEVRAHHGVLDSERENGQRFVIDVDLYRCCEAAADGDRLEATVDYGAVLERVRAWATDDPCRLIETLAQRLCRGLLREFDLERVAVTVHKPEAPLPDFAGGVSVRIERGRDWLDGTADGAQ